MVTRSKYFPDEAINPHPRFATLVENIRSRRGSKVVINVPIFPDQQTKDPLREINEDALFPDASDEGAAVSDNIYMDCMGFGMGCCCLQTTFQAFCISEARKIYDQLIPMAPIVMALTAATPIFRGYLVNTDCRWDVISASVDDRTVVERGKIRKSRYGSVSRYIFNGNRNKPEYNDLPLIYNENVYDMLCDAGIDELLAKHLAHLYIRDPLVIYEELLEQDNWNSTDHFENIQSTNWQTLRFKPPPSNSDIGWRVEFRSMEVQPDDHGNAAFSIFIVLLARTIFFFNLNFYLPLSLVDINMDRSHEIDAVLYKKFHFRVNVHSGIQSISLTFLICLDDSAEIDELNVNEIINGCVRFEGLIPLIQKYLSQIDLDAAVLSKLQSYLQFIADRASGKIPTPARAIRNFVMKHPSYNHDSKISSTLTYDLLKNFENLI